MNRKANREDVRNINLTFRMNKKESDLLNTKARQAEMQTADFLRSLFMDSIVVSVVSRKSLEVHERLLDVLLEYRTNFRRLSNLIKVHDPNLNSEIEKLVQSMQKVIDRL